MPPQSELHDTAASSQNEGATDAKGRETIRISATDARERKRRRRELLLAALLFLVVVVLSVVELKYLGVNAWLFMALFNLNFIFLLVVLLLVIRNGVKLLLERRRNVLGAKLRSRLVLAFISLSLVPTVLMYMVSAQFVQTSVEYWFNNQVGAAMEQALDVGQDFYASGRDRLARIARGLARNLGQDFGVQQKVPQAAEKSLQGYLDTKSKDLGLVMLGVLDSQGEALAWSWSPRFQHAWNTEMRSAVDWRALQENPQFWAMWWPGAGEDFVVGVMPLGIEDGQAGGGYLVLCEHLGVNLLYRLDLIAQGVEEYKKLQTMKRPLKVALFLIMGVLTLLIIFGAMWFGFRLAKELTQPIMALAEGTERIAKGDLSVRLEDTSKDEMGVLVRSFNRMAEDLEAMREGLEYANKQLGDKNLELAERGRYIETVLDNIAAGVVSVDGLGRISTVNKAAAAMLGVERESLPGKLPQQVFDNFDFSLLRDINAFVKDNPGAIWERQLNVRMRGVERTLLVNVVGLGASDATGPSGMVSVFEDITEIEKMQRMAAWREVARRIAHEIKNPLTPIKLSAQRLERKFGSQVGDSVFNECTGLIVQQVEHLQQMVQEFSAFAKLPEISPQIGRIEPLLEEVTTLFRHSHSSIAWDVDVEELPELRFDREGLRRGFINILTNAVEVLETPEHNETRKDARVRIQGRYDKALGLVRLEFEDNGPGLTPEERSRLFEPYFSRKKGGTGLGLTILKSIVTDHRGYVRVRPASSGGTVLVVELPVDAPEG